MSARQERIQYLEKVVSYGDPMCSRCTDLSAELLAAFRSLERIETLLTDDQALISARYDRAALIYRAISTFRTVKSHGA